MSSEELDRALEEAKYKADKSWKEFEQAHHNYLYKATFTLGVLVIIAAVAHRILESWVIFGIEAFMIGFVVSDMLSFHREYKMLKKHKL